jgi:hypothetical protein
LRLHRRIMTNASGETEPGSMRLIQILSPVKQLKHLLALFSVRTRIVVLCRHVRTMG